VHSGCVTVDIKKKYRNLQETSFSPDYQCFLLIFLTKSHSVPSDYSASGDQKRVILCISHIALVRGTRTDMMKRADHASNIVRFVITRIGWQRATEVLILRFAERESHKCVHVQQPGNVLYITSSL